MKISKKRKNKKSFGKITFFLKAVLFENDDN